MVRLSRHGEVNIEPPQIKVWEDTRTGPGVYILRARADDGALTADSDVTVTVER